MPQSPLAGGNDGLTPAGMFQTRGGALSKLNLSTAQVIKASKGRIARLIVLTAGSGGTLTLNDAATTGTAAAANAFYSVAGTLAAGTVVDLDWPCATGIVVSAVPTGAPVFAISYR